MPWRRRLNNIRHGVPWQLRSNSTAPSTAVVLTPRYIVGLLAFLICVDMTQVLGVLCYQLFLGTYFPWHLYPLMLNRAVELLALLCSDGHVPSVYSVAQIFLSILSMVICIQKEPCGKFNCVAALVLYGVLLTYQIFVAVMVVKIASIPMIGDDGGHGNAIWLQEFEAQRPGSGSLTSSPLIGQEHESLKDYNDVIIAVEQPDGEKYAIARLLKDIVSAPPYDFDEGSSHSMGGNSIYSKFLEDQKWGEREKKMPSNIESEESHGAINKDKVEAMKIVNGLEANQPSKPQVACEVLDPSSIEQDPNIEQDIVNGVLGSLRNKEDLIESSFLMSLSNEIISIVQAHEAKETTNKHATSHHL